jgi:hypothetical protein
VTEPEPSVTVTAQVVALPELPVPGPSFTLPGEQLTLVVVATCAS